MKNNLKLIKTIASVAVLMTMSNSVYAAAIGTAAETQIDNTASITYKVSGTIQDAIASSPQGNSIPDTAGTPTTFLVDKKIDLLVTGATNTNVVPGQTILLNDTGLDFTLVNEGNSTESFNLTPTDAGTIGTVGDEFNSANCVVTATEDGTAVVVPVTAPDNTVSLISGQKIDIEVECDIPSSASASNDDQSIVDLLATVVNPAGVVGTSGSACNVNNNTTTTPTNEACTVDVVNADDIGTSTDGAIQNGSHSAVSTYTINTADLTLTKTQAAVSQAIIDDGSGTITTIAGGYHIPGSIVTYTIDIDNNGSAATDLIVTDLLNSNLTFTSCAVTGAVVPSPPSTAITCDLVGGVAGIGGTATTSPFTLADGSTTATEAIVTIIAVVN